MKWQALMIASLLASGTIYGWQIVMPSTPTAAECTAEEELRHYLSTCVEGDIFRAGQPVEFHLGLAPENTVAPEDEAWQIAGQGNRIYLYGGGSRGTLYAVYRFLEQELGIRWWSPWDELCPKYANLVLDEIDAAGKPFFAMRDIYRSTNELSEDDGRWGVRCRLNRNGDSPVGQQFGGAYSFGRPYHVHTFEHYVNAGMYLETHPEYFSEVNGKRVGGQTTGQLCLTNPDVRRMVKDNLNFFIVQDAEEARANHTPAPRLYDISINDNSNYCRCVNCTAALQGGNQTDLLLDFINDIADSIHDSHPEIDINTLAYLYTETPPLRTRPRENVVIRFCDTSTNPAFGPEAPENQHFVQNLAAWSQWTDKLSIWDYSINYVRTGLPYPHEFTLADTIAMYADQQVKMMFWEHEGSDCADMWELGTYLEAKLLEEPGADAAQLREEFMQGFYGPAAPEIAEYRNLLYQETQKHHPYLHWFAAPPLFDHLTLDNLRKFDVILARAAQKAQTDAELLQKVNRVRLGIDRAVLLRFGILAQEHFAAGGNEGNFPFDRQELISRIRSTWEKSLERFTPAARQSALAKMEQELEIYGTMPMARRQLSTTFPGDSRTTCFFPSYLLNIFHPAVSFVADPEAESGMAATVAAHAAPWTIGAYAVTDNIELIAPREFPIPAENVGAYHWVPIGNCQFRHISVVYALGWNAQMPMDRISSQFAIDPALAAQRYEVWARVRISAESDRIFLDCIAVTPQSQNL